MQYYSENMMIKNMQYQSFNYSFMYVAMFIIYKYTIYSNVLKYIHVYTYINI
jgi:hypothetical protein